jgi:hypothetical protein
MSDHWPSETEFTTVELDVEDRACSVCDHRMHVCDHHHHAGVRIVQEGPTLVLVLDAHLRHPRLFSHQQLLPYAKQKPPAC